MLGEWWLEGSETESIKRLSVFKTIQAAPMEVSNSFQALTKAEEFLEKLEELKEPVESFNMLRRSKFFITKCKRCTTTSNVFD